MPDRYLEQIIPAPSGEPITDEMKALVRHVGLVHLALGQFERKLLERYEVFG
jgi:hypothetical protein